MVMSFLCTGPMPMPETLILLSSRYDRRASRDPSVLALTYTPSPEGSTRPRMESTSLWHLALSNSTSSPWPWRYTISSVPARAESSSLATTLTPIAPVMVEWRMYSFLTLISRIGGGVSSPLIVVTMGLSMPAQTMVSPRLRLPETRRTSRVVPMPSIFFTSRTEHLLLLRTEMRSLWSFLVSFTTRYKRSGIPSPVWAEVGTRGTHSRRSIPARAPFL
mmetsp:Transcript_10003/g.19199  ORF Transcript_10003/g.19199 Transcript_10003/m.19199 type:complete len:219 (+) Transcript_10003:967-1623(+)